MYVREEKEVDLLPDNEFDDRTLVASYEKFCQAIACAIQNETVRG